MTTYAEYGIKLTDEQRSKLAFAIRNKSPLTLRLKHSQLSGSDELMLTNRQIAKIKKAMAAKRGSDIKISRTQIRRSVKHGGNLFTSLAYSWSASASSGNARSFQSGAGIGYWSRVCTWRDRIKETVWKRNHNST